MKSLEIEIDSVQKRFMLSKFVMRIIKHRSESNSESEFII
jgi:hypothetical protein